MSKLRDPHICPDCRADLDPGATCTGCGLRLTGPLAERLWATMTTADALVEALRRLPVPEPMSVPVAAPPPPGAGTLPAAPPTPPTQPASGPQPAPQPGPQRLAAGSVPAVLFGVGALCLLIAAVVFVAVAWGSLGLGAKTTILLAVTAGFGGLAARLTRRNLRGGAETFWLVTGVLVAIDLGAAYDAGLLGYDGLTPRSAAAVLGATQVALGLAAAVLARRTELRYLVSATLLSTGGTVLVAAALAWTASGEPVATALSVPVLAAVAAALLRDGLRPAGYGVLGVAMASWVVLLVEGLVRAGSTLPADWWTGADCWPVLAAALLAGAVTTRTSISEPVRVLAATCSLLSLLLALFAPPYAEDTTLAFAAAVIAALAGASLVLPRSWSLPSAWYAALGTVGLGGLLLARPLAALEGHPAIPPGSPANLDLVVGSDGLGFAPWTAIVAPVAVTAALAAAVRWIDDPALRAPAHRTWLILGPTALALGLATAVLEDDPTLVVAVVAVSAVLAVLAVMAMLCRGASAAAVLLAAGYLIAFDLRLALPSHLLVALVAAAVAVGLAMASRVTAAGVAERAVLGAGTVVATALAAANAVYPFGGRADAAAVALVVVAVAAGLLARRFTGTEAERVVVELVAVGCGLLSVDLAADEQLAVALLTVTGSAVALVSVVHRDRDQVAWLGAAMLGAAALARVELDLELPELATAPAAVLLLAAGTRRLVSDDRVGSLRALGSGLTLGLLPTLLLALANPVSTRSLLVGVLALLALAVGIERRWAAPFLAGAGTMAVLAARHLGPVAEAVPRWISFGLVGIVLLAVAITWESRRQDLAAAERYLVGLR